MKYFDIYEFYCRGYLKGEGCCDGLPEGGMNEKLLELLDNLREKVDQPINVTCGYRCPAHNATIPGAAKHSLHMEGLAADIYCTNMDMETLANYAVEVGFTGVERNRDLDYVHVDVREEPYFWVYQGGVEYPCDEEGNIL